MSVTDGSRCIMSSWLVSAHAEIRPAMRIALGAPASEHDPDGQVRDDVLHDVGDIAEVEGHRRSPSGRSSIGIAVAATTRTSTGMVSVIRTTERLLVEDMARVSEHYSVASRRSSA